MKKYEEPVLEVTRFDATENIMDVYGGVDNNDGDIINIGTGYESYPEIDDLEMFFYS